MYIWTFFSGRLCIFKRAKQEPHVRTTQKSRANLSKLVCRLICFTCLPVYPDYPKKKMLCMYFVVRKLEEKKIPMPVSL